MKRDGRRQSVETRRKRDSEYMKKRGFNSAYRKKMSLIKKKYYSNPKALKKLREICSSLSYKNKVDKAMTKWWHQHPNIRKERSIEAKNLFIKHPEKFKKFLKYGNNPAALQFKTK